MKKSNILILILFLLFPIGLIIHHLSIYAAFRKGAFEDLPQALEAKRITSVLKSFHHVVINGKVRLVNQVQNTRYVARMPINISIGNKVPMLDVREELSPYVKTAVRNDTLYLWFECGNVLDWNNLTIASNGIKVEGTSLYSLNADSTNIEVGGIKQHSFNVNLKDVQQAAFYEIQVSNLTFGAERSYAFLISGKADTLEYRLVDHTELHVQPAMKIGRDVKVAESNMSKLNIYKASPQP